MTRDDRAEVLVVGAGPVGLLTALLLAEAGVAVKIIDEEARTATHSYACALHPYSLKLLERAGLAAEALRLGRRIESIAFYEGQSRRADIRLSELGGDFPFVLVLPQSALEDLLQNALVQKAGIKVEWNHRLADLKTQGDRVLGTIDQLHETMTGYVVPHEWVVKHTVQTSAAFLIGADGHNSLVRQRLGINYERLQGPEVFAVYEFTSNFKPGPEMCVVLDEKTSDVLWPISDGRFRWSFQL